MCKALRQSPLQLDQYWSCIKSPVLLYSSNYSKITTTITLKSQLRSQATNNNFDVNQQFNWKLHFVNQYCFFNTELRTATITKIKGLSIQTQQNTFVLFTLFKLTLDERKTLTKILMCKPLTTIPQNQHTPRTETKRQTASYSKRLFA